MEKLSIDGLIKTAQKLAAIPVADLSDTQLNFLLAYMYLSDGAPLSYIEDVAAGLYTRKGCLYRLVNHFGRD